MKPIYADQGEQPAAAATFIPSRNSLARIIAHLKRNQEHAANSYSIANKLLATALFGRGQKPHAKQTKRVTIVATGSLSPIANFPMDTTTTIKDLMGELGLHLGYRFKKNDSSNSSTYLFENLLTSEGRLFEPSTQIVLSKGSSVDPPNFKALRNRMSLLSLLTEAQSNLTLEIRQRAFSCEQKIFDLIKEVLEQEEYSVVCINAALRFFPNYINQTNYRCQKIPVEFFAWLIDKFIHPYQFVLVFSPLDIVYGDLKRNLCSITSNKIEQVAGSIKDREERNLFLRTIIDDLKSYHLPLMAEKFESMIA
jgi:hypothetical protein